ncbi:MAG TPA: IS21 family transposase [Thermodesulfobacteriota bacterium]|nr:IS21 family transposase [Thermodesulfobacteriota bacterium]
MEETLKQTILYLRDVLGLSFYQIQDRTGISRKRASRIYRGSCQDKSIRPDHGKERRDFILDPYRSLIAEWFKEHPTLKAQQAHGWLRTRGVKVSYPAVVKYTREFRKKVRKVYHPLTFLAGEEAQADWCFINHPQLGKLYGFVFILSYSRYLFAHVFARSSFEFFIEGHRMAFSALGGIPYGIRYDNLATVVLKRRPEVQYNPRFLEFSRHYNLEIRLCNPGAGNEKGRVERAIRTLRETFFNTMQMYSSLKALNHALHEWVDHKNHTIHRTTEEKPAELLQEERLRPLPEKPWNNVLIHPPVKTTKTAMMVFDTNSYSVPDYLVGKSLSIHSTPDTVMIYDGAKQVASHPRSFDRRRPIINPLHRSYGKLSVKAKMQRIYEAIKNLHPTISDFLNKNQASGEDPQKTAYEIFKLMKSHSRGMLVSVASECLNKRSPRLRMFLSYLHREPAEAETVQPQKGELLNISYQPRGLEVYDE